MEFGAHPFGIAPNNASPQHQKPPCNPSTRMAGVVSAEDGYQNAAMAFTFAGFHLYGAVTLLGAGCADFPADFVTCAPSAYGAVTLTAGGLALTGLGVYEVTHEMIPGIKQAVTCKQ